MAYDERLADRVRDLLGGHAGISERRMFGAVGFLLDGNMCCGVHGDELILRLGDEDAEAALAEPHGRPFDITPRPMKGWVLMHSAALEQDADLWRWVEPAVDFASSLPPK
jgi:TfoX/Sxy family transcriptional regulator of competence genes